MNKVAVTYWDNSRAGFIAKRSRTKSPTGKTETTPQWFVFTVIVSITFMLCLTINFRAYSEMSQETNLNDSLNSRIENLTAENLVLQEEIHGLRNDARAIEREARKIGLSRPNEKILVPTN